MAVAESVFRVYEIHNQSPLGSVADDVENSGYFCNPIRAGKKVFAKAVFRRNFVALCERRRLTRVLDVADTYILFGLFHPVHL